MVDLGRPLMAIQVVPGRRCHRQDGTFFEPWPGILSGRWSLAFSGIVYSRFSGNISFVTLDSIICVTGGGAEKSTLLNCLMEMIEEL